MHPNNLFIIKTGDSISQIFKIIFPAADPEFRFPVAQRNDVNPCFINKQKEMIKDDQKAIFNVQI